MTYLHAHLALKGAALAKLKPYERGKHTRFQPEDRLLAFLDGCDRPNYTERKGGDGRAPNKQHRDKKSLSPTRSA